MTVFLRNGVCVVHVQRHEARPTSECIPGVGTRSVAVLSDAALTDLRGIVQAHPEFRARRPLIEGVPLDITSTTGPVGTMLLDRGQWPL